MVTRFRKLLPFEISEVAKLINKGRLKPNGYKNLDELKAAFIVEGNFTTVVVQEPSGRLRAGSTKRNPNTDKDQVVTAHVVALVRALRGPKIRV